jgi:hypothetical protein
MYLPMNSINAKRSFWDGFFYFFKLTDNPTKKKIKEIRDKEPTEAIKDDLQSVKSDFRKTLSKIRELEKPSLEL